MGGYEINQLLVDPWRSGFTLINHQGQRETICSKPSCSTNSVHEICVIRVVETFIVYHRNVVINNEINFRYIDSSRQYICRYERCEYILTKVINDLITLVVLQSANQDFCFDTLRQKLLLKLSRTVLSVDEYHCHGPV